MSLPLSTPNWVDSTETGAPSINNVPGSGLSALIAFCVTGFNVRPVTQIDVVAGVATVLCPSHGFSALYGKLVKINGVPVAALNGAHRIGSVLPNTFTVPATGVADGTYTGTIEARRAPLGWEVAYINGASTVAILRRTAPESHAQMLRIDDTGTLDMRVLMVETATDVDTYTNYSPSTALLAGGQYWHKGGDTTTAKRFALVGNDRALFAMLPGSTAASPVDYDNTPMFFGDGVGYYPGDVHFTLLNGSRTALGTPTSTVGNWGAPNSNISVTGSAVVARSRDGTILSAGFGGFGPASTAQIGGVNVGQTTNNTVVVHRPVWIIDDFTTRELRGGYPGLAAPMAVNPFTAGGAFSVQPDAAGDGRTYLSALVKASSTTQSNILIDLTGPWY